jgi:hypothetical protein
LIESTYYPQNGASGYTERQITDGAFDLLNENLAIDKIYQLVFFNAKTNPLESHLCVASYHEKAISKTYFQLTKIGYCHSTSVVDVVSDEKHCGAYFASTFSSCINLGYAGIGVLQFEWAEHNDAAEDSNISYWKPTNSVFLSHYINDLSRSRAGTRIKESDVYWNEGDSEGVVLFPNPMTKGWLRPRVTKTRLISHPLSLNLRRDGTIMTKARSPIVGSSQVTIPLPTFFEFDAEDGNFGQVFVVKAT